MKDESSRRDGATGHSSPDSEAFRALEGELQRLRAENEALREAKDRAEHRFATMQCILDAIPTATYVKDRQGRFLYANAAAEVLYGVPAAELVGMLQRDTHMSAEQCQRVHLLKNACEAVQATERGQAGQRCTIGVRTGLRDDQVRIEVEDDGLGVPAEMLESITAALFSTKPYGVGLGLAIAREGLERHHGGLKLENSIDQGARVRLWVPLQQPAADDAAP